MSRTLFIVALVTFIGGVLTETLPDFIQVCHQSDPQLVPCLKRSVEYLRPYLARGIPQLQIPPIEPLHIGDLIVQQSVPGQGLQISIKDVKAYGPSNFILKTLNVVEFGRLYSFEVELPSLYADGQYNIDGRIILVPVQGNGPFRGNFTGGTGQVRIKTERVNQNGQNYLVVKKLDLKLKVRGGNIYLDNLFNGDQVLGKVVNDMINQNFDVFSKEIIPLIEAALSKHFKSISNKILSRYTEEQLFPQ